MLACYQLNKELTSIAVLIILLLYTQNDVITLSMIQQQLTDGCLQHATTGCSGPNNFTVKEQFGITNVMLSCEVSSVSCRVHRGWCGHVVCQQVCGFMYIVI